MTENNKSACMFSCWWFEEPNLPHSYPSLPILTGNHSLFLSLLSLPLSRNMPHCPTCSRPPFPILLFLPQGQSWLEHFPPFLSQSRLFFGDCHSWAFKATTVSSYSSARLILRQEIRHQGRAHEQEEQNSHRLSHPANNISWFQRHSHWRSLNT